MADFTIRVELHGATRQDYADLQEGLAAVGAVDYIKAADGTWYRLPPAEYTYTHATQTVSDVHKLARTVAVAIRPSPAVLVTKSAGRWLSGLEVIDDPT